jgi:ankyrin repeat protein
MTNIQDAIKNDKLEQLNAIVATTACDQELAINLFLAISLVKLDAVKVIYKHCNYSFTNVTNAYNNTPLKSSIDRYKKLQDNQDISALAASLNIVECSIINSDNINTRDTYCNTPIATAAYLGIPEITALLLRHGADYLLQDSDENNALDKALWEEKQNVVLEFFKFNQTLKDAPMLKRGQTPLTKMMYGRKITMIKFLLDQNVSKTAPTADLTMPRNIAEEINDPEINALLGSNTVDYL